MSWRRAHQRAAAVQILNAHATPCTTAEPRENVPWRRALLFPLTRLGNAANMIGLGIALVVLGVIFLFFLPWVGIPLGIVGLVLVILWLAGLARGRAAP